MNLNPLNKFFGIPQNRATIRTRHTFNDVNIPMKVFFENRTNVRISIGQKNILFRLPANMSESSFQKQMVWARKWMDLQFQKKPALLNRFINKQYTDGDILLINEKSFTINFIPQDRKTINAALNGQTITLKIPKTDENNLRQQAIKKAISKTMAFYFNDQVTKRIHYFNEIYFNEQLGNIRLKYNQSNWGSCSAKRNINISTRILFAPREVQDYVFIHELTHLQELNHSKRFWSIVSNIVPDYKMKEKWLRDNGHLCDF